MAPHSSTLAWKIPWMEEPGRLQSMGSLESDTTEQLHFHCSLSCIGEGNGNPLQCSCLENPRDGGAWWAAISGVAQSQTQLKWLSSSGRVPHAKCRAGWIISWNQDCQEKYQQPQICRWYPSNGRKWRGIQELLDEVEIGEWKSEFSNYDHGIWSHHFMANRRGEVEAVTDFIFLGSKITAHGDCSHEIKRRLLLGRKVMTNLSSILKSREFTLPTKIIVVQSSNCVQPFARPMDSSTPGFPVLHCSQSGQKSTHYWFFQ